MPRKWDRANGKACPRCADKVCSGLCWYSGWPRLLTGPGRRDFTKPTQPGRSRAETRQEPRTPRSIRKGKRSIHFMLCVSVVAHITFFCLHSVYLNLAVSLFGSSCQCMTLQSYSHLHPSIRSYCPPGSWFPFSCAGSTQCSADTHPRCCCPRSPTFSVCLSVWLLWPLPLSLHVCASFLQHQKQLHHLLFLSCPHTAPRSNVS